MVKNAHHHFSQPVLFDQLCSTQKYFIFDYIKLKKTSTSMINFQLLQVQFTTLWHIFINSYDYLMTIIWLSCDYQPQLSTEKGQGTIYPCTKGTISDLVQLSLLVYKINLVFVWHLKTGLLSVFALWRTALADTDLCSLFFPEIAALEAILSVIMHSLLRKKWRAARPTVVWQ